MSSTWCAQEVQDPCPRLSTSLPEWAIAGCCNLNKKWDANAEKGRDFLLATPVCLFIDREQAQGALDMAALSAENPARHKASFIDNKTRLLWPRFTLGRINDGLKNGARPGKPYPAIVESVSSIRAQSHKGTTCVRSPIRRIDRENT